MLGGFGHGQFNYWIEIVPCQQFPADATTTVGVLGDADIPGKLTGISQVEGTDKYIPSFCSEWAGFPPPLTNGGLNEHSLVTHKV